jgi:hypothetical protein
MCPRGARPVRVKSGYQRPRTQLLDPPRRPQPGAGWIHDSR